ncbi:MAG: O-methyltransferase [bacterium]
MANILFPSQKKYLLENRHQPDSLLIEIEKFAFENRVPILDWHAAEFLAQLIQIKRPKNVLEIGTAIAYSSLIIARNLRKKGCIDTIEKSIDNIAIAHNNIEKAGLKEKINILEGDALSIMPTLSKKYDFIFLDADKEDYEKLFYFSLMVLKEKGIIFIDNLLWKGFTAASSVPKEFKKSTKLIRCFNKIFLSQKTLHSSILPIGDGIGLGIKSKVED